MTLLSETQLAQMIPANKEVAAWCAELNKALPKYGVTTPHRIAGFISQCAHESADFTLLSENLNYREETLLRVFPRYFGAGRANAAEFARSPEKLANYVYMDKNRSAAGALGNVKEGDGWRFRGRGLKQLTGRSNYERFAKDYNMTAEQAAEWLETKEGALASALWFWDSRKLNEVADTGDIVRLTKIINGGDIGLDDRRRRYLRAMDVLSGAVSTAPAGTSPASSTVLRRGSKGEAVKKMQAALGIAADGDFGPGTEASLKKWQQANGLTADGVAGPNTLAKLLG